MITFNPFTGKLILTNDTSSFYKDGSKAATGDWDLDNNDIDNVKHLSIPTGTGRINVGVYGTISETNSGLAYITGNALAADPVASNIVVKTANDPGQFMRMRYDTGISFHTNLIGVIGTELPDTDNERLIIGLNGNITATGDVTASGAIARAFRINPTLTAAANNDVLVGLDIDPTFTVGSFTGVQSLAIRAKGQIIPSASNTYQLGTSSFIWSVGYINQVLTTKLRPISTELDFYSANGATQFARMYNATGNFTFQSGGTFTDDATNRLQVTGSIKATTNISIGSAGEFYLGDSGTDGTWRFVRSGNDLIFQRREGGSYVTKSTITA